MRPSSLLGICLLIFGYATTASAQRYGMAGCGLGALVIGNKPGIVQIFAATTNGTSGSQSFGISSGTSECRTSKAYADAFIEFNRIALLRDISKGSGETLGGLAYVYECHDAEYLGGYLHKNIAIILEEPQADTQALRQRIEAVMRKDERLRKDCVPLNMEEWG